MIINGFQVGEYRLVESGGKKTLVFQCKDCVYSSSLADDSHCRYHVIRVLQEAPADTIVFSEVYERVYSAEQTKMLSEIASMVKHFESESPWGFDEKLGVKAYGEKEFGERHAFLLRVAYDLPMYDPALAYIELLKAIKNESERMNGTTNANQQSDLAVYLRTLLSVKESYDKTIFIQKVREILTKSEGITDTNQFYKLFFQAQIKPSFIGSRLEFSDSEQLELLADYPVYRKDETTNDKRELGRVQVLKHPNKPHRLYVINPPEYSLPYDQFSIWSQTKERMSQYKPGRTSFSNISKNRDYFERVYKSTIVQLAQENGVKLSPREIVDLSEIVARYTVGYGMLEILFADRDDWKDEADAETGSITDIYVDAPIGQRPIYIDHGKFGRCQTNIFYTDSEAESLISKLRAMSGRPFDESHPVLDFDLEDFQTRVAVIGQPLSPDGPAFAFRLHKTTPWTLPQFVEKKSMTPLCAGLLSFFMDQKLTLLVTGSRGSGKCVDEDSLLQLANGSSVRIKDFVDTIISKSTKRVELDDGICIDLNANGLEEFTINMSPKLKMEKVPISKVWRRKAPKKMVQLKLRSGKEIITTPEHPFFLTSNGKIIQKRADELSVSDFVATPRVIPVEPVQNFSLDWIQTKWSFEPKMEGIHPLVKGWLDGYSKDHSLKVLAKDTVIPYRTILNIKNSVRKTVSFSELKKLCHYFEFDFVDVLKKSISWRFYNSKHQLKTEFFLQPINLKTARFLGLLLGDGHVDHQEVCLTNTDLGLLNEFKQLCKELFGVDARIVFPKNRSPNCLVTSTGLARVISLRFGIPMGKKAPIQQMPVELLNASDELVSEFLRAYFDCDGSVDLKKRMVESSTASKRMSFDVQNALLRFGIVSFNRIKIVKGRPYYITTISGEHSFQFSKKIGFSLKRKQEKLAKAFTKQSFNTNVDVIPHCLPTLQTIQQQHRQFTVQVVHLDQKNVSRNKLQQLLVESDVTIPEIAQLKLLAQSDLFWDEVSEAKRIDYEKEFVYDLSIDETHNFVVNGIVAHNTSLMQSLMLEIPQNTRVIVQEDTLEIPVPYMKDIGFDIQRLKTRSPISVSKTETEVAPEEALRTALRLGDSAIIMGEVRSLEAKVLYEAMRIGAAGNIIMGTIHGDDAYSVWDRVVNDLGVPNTSFKATDIVVTSKPIRFGGSLNQVRRVSQVTEIKKHWTEDPEREGGLLDLMLYDARTDRIDLLEDNLKESDLFNKISRLSGLSMQDMWNQIKANASAKEFLVELKREAAKNSPDPKKNPLNRILEAENTTIAHNKFLLLRQEQIEKYGSADYDELLGEWKNWCRNSFAKRLAARK